MILTAIPAEIGKQTLLVSLPFSDQVFRQDYFFYQITGQGEEE
jgi:hypothetical protein